MEKELWTLPSIANRTEIWSFKEEILVKVKPRPKEIIKVKPKKTCEFD